MAADFECICLSGIRAEAQTAGSQAPEDNKIIWYLAVWLIAAALVFSSQLRND